MSQANYIECDQCRESVLIGQRNHVYLGLSQDTVAYGYFLMRHYGHCLVVRQDNHSMLFNHSMYPWFELKCDGRTYFLIDGIGRKAEIFETLPDEPISYTKMFKGVDRFGTPICVDYEGERERGLEWQDKHT